MKHRCLICADDIAAGDLLQHLTGDYHSACFSSIAAAGSASNAGQLMVMATARGARSAATASCRTPSW
jgi:hypothetical protein